MTGGCGFFGSHLTEALIENGWDVTVLDDLSSGSRTNLEHVSREGRKRQLRVLVGDCATPSHVGKALLGAEVVFHFAASPEVQAGLHDPRTCFHRNVYATHVLLEQMRRSSAETIVFPSTSSVYGDAKLTPTPENYSPLEPISLYAASKLSSEALLSAYAHTYGKSTLILRFANIVGSRSKHGVIVDFLKKLRKDPHELEVLGDGNQLKSYVHVSDCVSAVLKSNGPRNGFVDVYNVGSEDRVTVRRIAEIVVEEMGLEKVSFKFVSTTDNGGGWAGDVKNMLLDIEMLKSKGWAPRYNSEDAIRLALKELRTIGAEKSRIPA